MEVLKYIVMAIYVVVCVALVILVTKQNKEDGGASGTIVGASANNFYEKNKCSKIGTRKECLSWKSERGIKSFLKMIEWDVI